MSPIPGSEAWPARPLARTTKRNVPFSAQQTPYSRRSPYGITGPPPSLTRKSQRAASGRWVVSHWAPIAPPASSSTTLNSFSSPRAGRQPSRASVTAATASAAVWDFMSSAPRPHRWPSWTSPHQGSCVQSCGSA